MADLKDVSVVVTSYNRWNFLKECVNSFNKLTGGHSPFIIIEDSAKPQMKANIEKEWGNKVQLIFNDKNIGQAASMDKAYSTVNTKYVLHVEDDYKFVSNPNFIKNSVSILEERDDVHQIWIRKIENFKVSHGADAPTKLFEQDVCNTKSNVPYRMVKVRGPWNGFSFMPGIRRIDDWKLFFPNGYVGASKGQKPGVMTEVSCARHVAQFNYRAALLLNGSCQTTHKNSTYK